MKSDLAWRRSQWLLSVATLLPSLLTGCASFARAHAVLPATPRTAAVIPDTGGPISELALHFLADSEMDLVPTYADMFTALPPDVSLQVLCPSELDVQEFLRRWGDAASAGGRSVRVINVQRPITIWSRDRRIARQLVASDHPGMTIVPATVPDYTPDKCAELTIPQSLVAAGVSPEVSTIGLHIEGGNIVANNRQAFIGANVYAENAEAFPDRSAIDRMLHDLLGRPYLVVSDGEDQVPWCHVDMYMTPIDDTTVLVASPSLTLCLLSSSHACPDGNEDARQETEIAETILAGDAILDLVADRLAAADYQVYRLPALIDPNEDWMITYNNVLMECRNGKKIVYMPVYHLGVLDEAAVSIYRSLGFEVRTIDVSGIYRDGGAIRCIANVTARRPYVGPLFDSSAHQPVMDLGSEPADCDQIKRTAAELLSGHKEDEG